MNNKKTMTQKETIKLTLILNVIVFALFFFLLLFNVKNNTVFPDGNPFEVFGYFLKSSRVLPEWLSVIVLLSGVIIEIINYIVLFFDERIKKIFPDKNLDKPFKILNVIAIISLPVWFSLLTFYQFNFSRFGGELFSYDLDFSNAVSEPFIFMIFLTLAITITFLTLVINLNRLGLKIPYKAVLPAVITCLILNKLATPTIDVLYYGFNFKEELIVDHQHMMHSATNAEYSDEESSAYTTYLGGVYYDDIIDSMEIKSGEIILNFKFQDSYTGETLWATVKGERLWFGKYYWTLVGDISSYWEDHTHPKQKT